MRKVFCWNRLHIKEEHDKHRFLLERLTRHPCSNPPSITAEEQTYCCPHEAVPIIDLPTPPGVELSTDPGAAPPLPRAHEPLLAGGFGADRSHLHDLDSTSSEFTRTRKGFGEGVFLGLESLDIEVNVHWFCLRTLPACNSSHALCHSS